MLIAAAFACTIYVSKKKDFTFESHVTSLVISEDVFEMHLDSDVRRASQSK